MALFLLLGSNSCIFLAKKPAKVYPVSIEWSADVNVSYQGSGSDFARGYSGYYVDKDKSDHYTEMCRKEFEKKLMSNAYVRPLSTKDKVDIVTVYVKRFTLQETIAIQKDPDGNESFNLHEICATIYVEVYKDGEKIDDFTRTICKSQDITANSKNTGYKIQNPLISEDNAMRKASRQGANGVVIKLGQADKKAEKQSKK